jgi:hypothetical protein
MLRSTVWAVLCASLVALPALASHGLDEPPGLAKLVKGAKKAEVAAGLSAAGLTDKCAGALEHKDLHGLDCRIAAAAHLSSSRGLKSVADVEVRVAVANDLEAAARSIASYTPLAAEPGFGRMRFEAHRRACTSVLESYDALTHVVTKDAALRARVDQALGLFPKPSGEFDVQGGLGFKDAACNCIRASLGLAPGSDASPEESGALQSQLTSHNCFLDEAKIKGQRAGPATTLQGSADARKVAADSTQENRLLEFAAGRSLELDRCRDKIEVPRIKDGSKVEKCVCGVVDRWQFPARKGAGSAAVKLPIVVDKLFVNLDVNEAGKVASCSGLSGPLLAP